MRLFRNATSRFVALYLFLAAASTSAVLAFVYWSTTKLIDAQVRQVVETDLEGLADDYSRFGVIGLSRAIQRRLADTSSRDAVYLLTDRQGRRITGNLGAWPPTVSAGQGWVNLELFRTDSGQASPIAAASLSLAQGERLLVGRDAQARIVFDRTLLRAVGWALALTGVLGVATGWFATRFILRRIDDVTTTAGEIVVGDLARRIPVRGGSDEFTRLAETLNRMLDRIEALVSDLRMVTDSVAHDLRSPLTRLHGHLDEALRGDFPEQKRRELIAQAKSEAEFVLRAFTGLVDIARIEAGVGRDQFERVDLSALAADLTEIYGPVAEEKNIRLRSEGDRAVIHGHAHLLGQALTNLIENALKFAPEGSDVTIATSQTASGATLSVTDAGPGIPAADRERVLKRFERLDRSRSKPGSGLGLSLVDAVARMHGATLRLEDAKPGLRVRVEFPCRSQVPPAG
ncbi:MAG: sensor histidine kinase [Paracoccaceae bacterium]